MTEQKDEQRRVVGKIIKVSASGWGFISSREIEFTRIFFHWTALRQDTLTFKEVKIGMKCEFIPLQIEGRGWRAVQMRMIQDTTPRIPEETTNETPTVSEL